MALWFVLELLVELVFWRNAGLNSTVCGEVAILEICVEEKAVIGFLDGGGAA